MTEEETQRLLGSPGPSRLYGESNSPSKESETNPGEPKVRTLKIKQSIGLTSGILVIVGSIVGTGLFITPNMILKSCNGSVGASLVVWCLGGLVAILSTLCYCELSASIRESGGDYTFLRLAYGPTIAFLIPWTNCFLPTSDALTSLAFATYALQPFYPCQEAPQSAQRLLAICLLLLAYAINALSTKWAVRCQATLTSLIFLTILFIVGSALYYGSVHRETAYDNFVHAFDWASLRGITFVGIANAFYQVMWTYEGWNSLSHVTEEVDRPRNVALASILGIFIVVIISLFVIVSYLLVLTPDQMLKSSTVVATFAKQIFGTGSWTVSILVCLVTSGAINSSVMTFSRSVFVAARNGNFPQVFHMIQVTTSTPVPTLIICAIPTVVLIGIGQFSTLLGAFGFTSWTFYTLISLSVIVLRWKEPERPRPFKVPLVVPAVMVVLSAFFVVVPFISNPHFLYFYALGFLVVGALLHRLVVLRNVVVPGSDRLTLFLQKVLNVAAEDLECKAD